MTLSLLQHFCLPPLLSPPIILYVVLHGAPASNVTTTTLSPRHLSIQNYWKLRCIALLLTLESHFYLMERMWNRYLMVIHIATLRPRNTKETWDKPWRWTIFANELKRIIENSDHDIFRISNSRWDQWPGRRDWDSYIRIHSETWFGTVLWPWILTTDTCCLAPKSIQGRHR